MEELVLISIETDLTSFNLLERFPPKGELRVKADACRIDLHVVDGALENALVPIIPGHEGVGRIDRIGEVAGTFHIGQRVGIPALGPTCGLCRYYKEQRETLCDHPSLTGRIPDVGFATKAVVDAGFTFRSGSLGRDESMAPLLCAGLIACRALSLAGDGRRLGLYGFGAASHIVATVAQWQGRSVYAFTEGGDTTTQTFARTVGPAWAGRSDELPPQQLDAAIIFAVAGALVPLALRAIHKSGRVICAGIHMSDIPRFTDSLLWGERQLMSVANMTREDGIAFLEQAPRMNIESPTTAYPLNRASHALAGLHHE